MNFPWEEHYPRLIAFAEWIIQGKHWNSNKLPKGQTAETIVRDVIAKTFSEERNWDPERGDLLMWLKWVIRSDISHLAESASNRLEVPLNLIGENESRSGGVDSQSHLPPPQKLEVGSPEEVAIATETESEKVMAARLKIDALLEACSGKPELEQIVYAIIDGGCAAKPQELSEFLGKPVNEINQNLRALRRRASKIRIEARNGQK
jgi:DNA-directed RNA polymerase specialized sigma24 family protein